jgi:hypothetical protein
MNTSADTKTNLDRPVVTMVRTAEAAAEVIPRLIPIYQAAFAGEPWNEVSRCSPTSPCAGQISDKEIGETCPRCGEVLRIPAHPAEVLRERWTGRFNAYETRLYLEQEEGMSYLLAALAWRATPQTLAAACYAEPGEEGMQKWLSEELPESFVWMEEVFANLALRQEGSLWNYEAMVRELLTELDSSVFVFRTINARLIAKTKNVFGPAVQQLTGAPDPDKREVLIVRLES